MNEISEIKIIAEVWQTHEDKKVRYLMSNIFILAKRAQQRLHMTAFAVGGLCFFAGVVIGIILEAG